jgi:hypothetical protein
MDWATVFKTVGLGAIALATIAGAIAWVAREISTRWLDSRIELFREQVRRESLEHQVRFESLHAKRAEAILAIWRALRQADSSVNLFVYPAQMSGPEGQSKQGEDAGECVVTLKKLVFENLIFFSQTTASQIDQVARRLDNLWFGAWLDYKQAKEDGRNPYLGKEFGEASAFGQAWQKLQAEIRPLVAELEAEFRTLLGT